MSTRVAKELFSQLLNTDSIPVAQESVTCCGKRIEYHTKSMPPAGHGIQSECRWALCPECDRLHTIW